MSWRQREQKRDPETTFREVRVGGPGWVWLRAAPTGHPLVWAELWRDWPVGREDSGGEDRRACHLQRGGLGGEGWGRGLRGDGDR